MGASVYSIALQANGRIIVAGSFVDVDGVAALDKLVRLNPEGPADTGFVPPANFIGTAYRTALQSDGMVIVGGGTVGGFDPNLVRLDNGAATGTLTVPNLSKITWTRGGTAPEATRTTFEYSTNSGVTFVPLGAGTRITGGWEITGVGIPSGALVRARAFTSGGLNNASSGIVQATASAAAPGDTWTQYYGLANYYYGLYASAGYYSYAAAYYFYYNGFGDYTYHAAYGRWPEANYAYNNGLGLYYYNIYAASGDFATASYYYNYYIGLALYAYYSGYGSWSLAGYYLNYYLALAYYTYYAGFGDYASAAFWYNYFIAQANAA